MRNSILRSRASTYAAIAASCYATAGLAAISALRTLQISLPENDGARDVPFVLLLLDPFVLILAVPATLIAGTVALPIALWALADTDLSRSIPVTGMVVVLAAAVSGPGHLFIAVPVTLLAGLSALLFARLFRGWKVRRPTSRTNGRPLLVRDLRPGEEWLLLELFRDTVRRVNLGDYSSAQVEAWAPDDIDPSTWAEKMRSRRPFVAEADAGIVGYADLQADGLVDHFYVHHQWQRKGVGRALISEIERRAAAAGIDRLHTHASITARSFFEAFGFSVVREHEVVKANQRLHNFFMERDLAPRPGPGLPGNQPSG